MGNEKSGFLESKIAEIQQEMSSYGIDILRKRMEAIADMYTMCIFYNKLQYGRSWDCGGLLVTPYNLVDTFYTSTAIFHAEDLIAIVAENNVMYEFVGMCDESDEMKTTILSELDKVIETSFPAVINIIRYPHDWKR